MIPRPRFRMPLWAALAVVAVAYLARSTSRGFDFAPDMPTDLVVLAALLIVVSLVAWVRADDARRDSRGDDTSTADTTDPEP